MASQELAALRAENAALKARLEEVERRLGDVGVGAAEGEPKPAVAGGAPPPPRGNASWERAHGLSLTQVERFSRHILLSWFGVAGAGLIAQEKLCNSSVLIVGAGGLGSPALLYLAAAGVGTLGLCDRDAVDVTNLHRQVAHGEPDVGCSKTDSAASAARRLNSAIRIIQHPEGLRPDNAAGLVKPYDVVLDCTDNAPSRYLLSDACASPSCRTPLVSGAALGGEGQLTVYCGGPAGPCYRCLFPASPAAGNCARCADAGVLGPVPGVVGVLQALEAIKLLTGVGDPLTGRLLLYDALAPSFRVVKLRPRSPTCVACSVGTGVDVAAFDYASFTGASPHDGAPPPLRLLGEGDRWAPATLAAVLRGCEATRPPVLDVRPAPQFELGRLPGSVSVPYDGPQFVRRAVAAAEAAGWKEGEPPLVVVCRRGNDSQRAVADLRAAGVAAVDVAGGLAAWAAGGGAGDFPQY